MDHARRNFLSLSALAPMIALPLETLLTPGTAGAQGVRSVPRGKPMPLPEDAENPAPEAPNADPKVILEHNQLQMKEAVQKLYTLVEQLKHQVDRTDSTSVLSLNLVDSAKKVEDLAKQIRNLARA